MIPLRIMLRGFLCYRDEQEVLLDGSSLWMMAGLNGSGKSAIFDAMTYALFGYHRGGSQQVVELINHDSDRLAVEFDFALEGDTYRVRRTAIRQPRTGGAKTTQQVLKRIPPSEPNQSEDWEPIATTGTSAGFKTWVHDHVGLTYETFTSSVLLLQGRSEKLLDSSAVGRFEVLAGIVDLDRYRRLHERADARRKELKSNVEVLRHQLEGLPQVSDADLAGVDQQISEAEAAIGLAQQEVTRLGEVEQLARQWGDLLNRKITLERRWREAEGTLGEAEAIQKDLTRLRELNEVVPLLRNSCDLRQKVRHSLGAIEKLTQDEQSISAKLTDAEHRIKQTAQSLNVLQKQRDRDEARHRELQKQLRDLSAQVNTVNLCEQQREKLAQQRKELGQLPNDLPDRVSRLREDLEQVQEVQRVIPLATSLARQRKDLRQARELASTLEREEQERKARGADLRKQADALKEKTAQAERAHQEAHSKAVELKTLLDQARASVRDFQGLRGAQVCRHCGQPLTPGHYAEEKRKREAQAEAARLEFQQADEAQKKFLEVLTRSRQEQALAEGELGTARDEFLQCKNRFDQARKEIDRLSTEVNQTVADLPALWRERAAGAGIDGEPSFPSEADLRRLREQVERLEPTRKQLKETETQLARWQALKAQVEQTQQTLQSLEASLPDDVEALRRKHLRLSSDETALVSSLKATREQERQTSEDLQKLNEEKNDLHRKKTDIGGKLTQETSQRKLNLEEIERIRQRLPAAWQMEADRAGLTEITRFSREREQLIQADTENRAKKLEQARITLESLRLGRAELEKECETFPEQGRVQLTEVQRELHAARSVVLSHETKLREAQRKKAVLESQREQRRRAEEDQVRQEGELSRYALLAQLLGRERLQRHLVRQAERQVIDHANAVLDRLSGGQLYLRLKGGDEDGSADKALELEVFNRSTTQAPINVAFLSGSQRFRVAVSLALGLGQYASRQDRPIESVIIDEGFGCLDRQGRQVMIQELQNLRGQLRCILLVSHQEEFADAFSDGYLFELNEGATRVRRFQR